MPFIQKEDINKERCWGVWEICETEEQLLRLAQMKEKELDYLNTIIHPQKRLEHLAGRCAAKALLSEKKCSCTTIIRNEIGRPVLPNNEAKVSISHSGKYAAAIVDLSCDVGIDIQQLDEKLHIVAPRILSERELKMSSNIQQKAIMWGAKEALYKLTAKEGIDFRTNLCIEDFPRDDEQTLSATIYLNGKTDKYQLIYQLLDNDDYIVVLNIA